MLLLCSICCVWKASALQPLSGSADSSSLDIKRVSIRLGNFAPEPKLGNVGDNWQLCYGCREDLQVGEEVQIMPCKSNHVYHPDCLAPWLKAHNSCPVCRFELPTDDMAYENKKERDQREAEERKGAANAVTHTDFLYI